MKTSRLRIIIALLALIAVLISLIWTISHNQQLESVTAIVTSLILVLDVLERK